MPAAPLLILVHGTGAGRSNPADRRWWESESQTAQDLARASPDGPAELAPFRWTGRNSEKDRRAAGRALLENLREYERAGRDYRLIGHSHGGSVIWHALTASVSGAPLAHLKCWITVGTPFLRFRIAWTNAWILLAAIWAVWMAWKATSLLLAAWPDRALIIRHTDRSVIFGHVVTWILAATCALLLLILIALCGALVLRSFPALRNISRRVQFAAGAVAVSISIGGGVWFVLWSRLVHDSAPKAGLWAIAALITALWILTAALIAGTFRLIGCGLEQWRRNRREREAVALYGPLWRPFTHAFDETVAGLAASRVSPYPVAAPRPGPEASVFRQLIAIVLAPLAAVTDDFVWWMLMRRLQGADIWGLMLAQAGAAPNLLSLSFGNSALADSAAQALLESAAKGLGELGSDLREKLVRAGQVLDAMSAVEIVGSAIKWTEVVHTLYFRDLRMMGLLEAALAEKPRAPLLKPPPPLPPGSHAHRFLPLAITICFVAFAAIWGLGQAIHLLHVAYIKPYLTATQFEIAAGAKGPSVDKNPIVGEYLVRLSAWESIQRSIAPPDKITHWGKILVVLVNPFYQIDNILRSTRDKETHAAAAQRLAFAHGFGGNDATRWYEAPAENGVLARSAETEATWSPDSNNEGPIGRRTRKTIPVHILAGTVAARRTPSDKLVQSVIDTLGQRIAGLGMRELYCTAIPSLFAIGRTAEATEFFTALDRMPGTGCDEALDTADRQKNPPLPCIPQERIATMTALLGKAGDAIQIAKTCADDDRRRLLLLRLVLKIEDNTAAKQLLDAAEKNGEAAPSETLLRSAGLAKVGRLDEASLLATPLLADPKKWFDAGNDKQFRPLFDVLTKIAIPGPLLDHVIAAQDAFSKASDDFQVSAYQTLELARMLHETKRSAELATVASTFIDTVKKRSNKLAVMRFPSTLIDGAEAAVLIGRTDSAAELLSYFDETLKTMNVIASSEHLNRIIPIARNISPGLAADYISKLLETIPQETDAEERARLYSIVSGEYLKNGDPVFAIQYAQEAGLPHRVFEAYCRVLDRAIKTSAVAPSVDYGLGYAYWPAPSFIDSEKNFAFRDAFGPLTCDAPWPVDRRN